MLVTNVAASKTTGEGADHPPVAASPEAGHPLLQSVEPPDRERYRAPYAPFMVTVGAYPAAAMAGGNTVGTTHAITGAATVPETPTLNKFGEFAAGVAGYGRSFNGRFSRQGGVGLYGAGLAAASETSAWSANVIVANLPDLSQPQTGHGQTNVNLWGLEVDMNVQAAAMGALGGNATGSISSATAPSSCSAASGRSGFSPQDFTQVYS